MGKEGLKPWNIQNIHFWNENYRILNQDKIRRKHKVVALKSLKSIYTKNRGRLSC